MALTIANYYNLSNAGSRKLGLTRGTRFQGPHAHRFNNQSLQAKNAEMVRDIEVDINAPPQDSSEGEEPQIFEAEEYGEASDASDSDVTQWKSRSSQQISQQPSKTTPRRRHEGVESQVHQSQSYSRKRKANQMSDNETPMNISFQSFRTGSNKKPAAGYGKSRAKPEKKQMPGPVGGKVDEGAARRRYSQGEKEGAPNFIRPPTESLLAELEKQIPPLEPSISSSRSSRRILSHKTTKRSERQYLGQPSLSQSEEPFFRVPQPSSQTSETLTAKSASKRQRELPRDINPSQVPRSSPELKSTTSTSSKLNSGPSSDSAVIAARMLGLEDATFRFPSLIPGASSPTDKACASSSFSSPAISLNDEASSTVAKTILVEGDLPNSLPKVDAILENPCQPKCPMCKAPVDSLFLEGFSKHRRLTIREQARFCKAHQQRTAENEWEAKGYPAIDWSCLHMQVKIHSEVINEILKGERFSYYRNAYEDFLKREKHRTLQQSLVQGGGIENFSPGYYGSRGARIMIDNLMSTFASKLRRRSSKDNLISARGVTNYVRAVLVPELATLLVMDDMKIDAEEARKVLRESVDLGNILNEEQDEVIKDLDIDYIS